MKKEKNFDGNADSNIIKYGKWEFNKLSKEEQKERDMFRGEFYGKLGLLNDEQKEFFLDIIDYANNNSWDFDIDSIVEKKRPNSYGDILFLFRCLTKVGRLDNKKIDKILRKRKSDVVLKETKEELKKNL